MHVDQKPAKRRQKKTDATWKKMHGKGHFGYKLSVNADRRYKLIRKLETETVQVHDGQHFKTMLEQKTRMDVYAARGYPSQTRESDQRLSGADSAKSDLQANTLRMPATAKSPNRQGESSGRTCPSGEQSPPSSKVNRFSRYPTVEDEVFSLLFYDFWLLNL